MQDYGQQCSMDQDEVDFVDNGSYKPRHNGADGVWEAPRSDFEFETGRLDKIRLTPL